MRILLRVVHCPLGRSKQAEVLYIDLEPLQSIRALLATHSFFHCALSWKPVFSRSLVSVNGVCTDGWGTEVPFGFFDIYSLINANLRLK